MLRILMKCFTFFDDHAGTAQRAAAIVPTTLLTLVLSWGMPVFLQGGVASILDDFGRQYPLEKVLRFPLGDPKELPSSREIFEYLDPLVQTFRHQPLTDPVFARVGMMLIAALLSIQTGRMYFQYLVRTVPDNAQYNPSPLVLIIGLRRFFLESLVVAVLSFLQWLPIAIALLGVAIGSWFVIGFGLAVVFWRWSVLLPKKTHDSEITHKRGNQFTDFGTARKRERKLLGR